MFMFLPICVCVCILLHVLSFINHLQHVLALHVLISFARCVVQFGFIDAHWMFDDGGMTPLLCHVLTMSKAFEQCRLRVFYADMNEEDEVRCTSSKRSKHCRWRRWVCLDDTRLPFGDFISWLSSVFLSTLSLFLSLSLFAAYITICRRWRIVPPITSQ